MTIATNIHVHQLKYDNHLILGFVLDSPKSDLVVFSNTINVCGWVLGKKTPAVAVEMVKEQQIVAQSHVNIHRPRVAENYPDISNSQYSGFEFELDLKKNLLGSQNFSLQVVLENHTKVPVVMLDVNSYEHKLVKKTFFIHVGKTAGTSFNHFLRTHLCGEEHCEKYKNRDSFHNLNKLKTFDFISGHLRLQDFNQNFDRKDYYLVTILRDPIEQLISNLNWVIYISNDVKSEFFNSHSEETRKMSLDIRHKNLHNTEDVIKVLCDYRSFFHNNQSRYFQLNQDLKPAEIIDILRDFDLVGITENYFQFISDYINLVGLNINPEIHMENKNVMPAISKNELLSNSEFVAFCHEYNSVDIQVYNHYSKKKT